MSSFDNIDHFITGATSEKYFFAVCLKMILHSVFCCQYPIFSLWNLAEFRTEDA